MIIAISGTPGTGKTTVSRVLAGKIKGNFVRIRDIIHEIPHKKDRKRDTFIVDVKDLQKLVSRKLKKGNNIVEGHLAHMLDVNVVLVLRCDPKTLERRLKRKGWKKAKIDENVKAEILDAITIEALELHGTRRVFEIDTTKRTEQQTARIAKNILNNFARKKYLKRHAAGKIDWTEKYEKMLIKP